ncbi:hypothetical protein RHSIM_Rhsim05G0215100 [Rhododendron simsii]|uniref:Uncharacterized protein n=1 Tax=Rhododendron simsii TaxID=118357 RepID=A0A834GXI4_RHOSS|nr:hypothetical protein RHSIM_Rhsim05G0215100 [Rhododendron simsii]
MAKTARFSSVLKRRVDQLLESGNESTRETKQGMALQLRLLHSLQFEEQGRGICAIRWDIGKVVKTEWTREGRRRRRAAGQWRTIAPIVGRTASQCLERYEKSLDAACAKNENYKAGDDPRKLHPGDMTRPPESKPACPDTVDMDGDEKEMLQLPQAWLANTRGKKAKRKARGSNLKRPEGLASLQKRRELKAAGIHTCLVTFLMIINQVVQPKFPNTVGNLEGERRVDAEARLRKRDIAGTSFSRAGTTIRYNASSNAYRSS